MPRSLHRTDRLNRLLAYVLPRMLAALSGFYETVSHLQAHNHPHRIAEDIHVGLFLCFRLCFACSFHLIIMGSLSIVSQSALGISLLRKGELLISGLI